MEPRINRRSVRGTWTPLVILVVSFAGVGCSARPPVGGSTGQLPLMPSSESLIAASPHAASTTPPDADAVVIELPPDLFAQVAAIPWIRGAGENATVQFLGSTAVTFDGASEQAYVVADYAPGGSFVTVVTSAGDTSDILEIDPVTGGRRLIATIESDGTIAVHRHPDGDYLLAGKLGVELIDVVTGERRELVPPESRSEVQSGAERYFRSSPSGNMAAATLCWTETCVVDVIDTADWSVRRLPETQVLLALSDSYALTFSSLDDRRPRLLDLETLDSRIVAPQLATLNSAYARDDGAFVAFGSTSWPYEDPVHRPLVLVDPVSGVDQILVDQGPDDWAYPYMGWTSNDWILLIPELAAEGRRPGVRVAVDTRTGTKIEFKLDDQGRAVMP